MEKKRYLLPTIIQGVESVGFSSKVFNVVNIPASGYSIYRMDGDFLTHGVFILL